MMGKARYLIGRRGGAWVGVRLQELSEVGRLPVAARELASRPGAVLQLHGAATALLDPGDLPGLGARTSEPPAWFAATRGDMTSCIALDEIVGIRVAEAQTTAVSGAGGLSGFVEVEGRSVAIVSCDALRALGHAVPGVDRNAGACV